MDMTNKLRYIVIALFCLITSISRAEVYEGRVIDANGAGIGYATIYPVDDPVAGTATNTDGGFRFETDLPPDSKVIISFIGYEKVEAPLFRVGNSLIVLNEQPIELEETVVAAKKTKQKNKRKQMAYLLHQVMLQMEADFPHDPVEYRIVSDVRMDSEGEAWGMEQMIARIVEIPEAKKNGRDSVQFAGEYCKRYFDSRLRALADTILNQTTLENLDKKSKKNSPKMRDMAVSIDSGVVVHKGLWSMGHIRYDFEETMNEVSKWVVSNESEGETVLTHTQKKNILGIFRYEIKRHYILNSDTYSVRRFSEQGEVWINIPFGYKLNPDQVQLLNLLNMSDKEIEKFRLKKAHAIIHLNTIYQYADDKTFTLEKNLHTKATLEGTKKTNRTIELDINATQRATSLRTKNVQPMSRKQMTSRIKRQIVPIY